MTFAAGERNAAVAPSPVQPPARDGIPGAIFASGKAAPPALPALPQAGTGKQGAHMWE